MSEVFKTFQDLPAAQRKKKHSISDEYYNSIKKLEESLGSTTNETKKDIITEKLYKLQKKLLQQRYVNSKNQETPIYSETDYTNPKEIKATYELQFKEIYFQTLGLTENEYIQLVSDKKLRNLVKNSKILQRYSYDETDENYDLYFFGTPFEAHSIQINIRPTRFSDDTNDYKKDISKKIPLNILKVKFFESAFLVFLKENKNLEQEDFDTKLKDFFEKVIFLKGYKDKAKKYLKVNYDEFEYVLKHFLEKYGSKSHNYFRQRFEENLFVETINYNQKLEVFFSKMAKRYDEKFVRINKGRFEVSASADFKNEINGFFSIPNVFIENLEQRFELFEGKDNREFIDEEKLMNWVEEKLKGE